MFYAKKNDKVGEILVYEVIGDDWFGGLSAKAFADGLKGLGDVDTINVRINSPGGDVFEGVSIFNQLRTHKAAINVQIEGLAASIASLIAMAGDEIRIGENAAIMIHNPWGIAIGEASEMDKMSEILTQIKNESLVPTYVKKTGLKANAVSDMLDEETWLYGPAAVDQGFADGLLEDEPDQVEEEAEDVDAKASILEIYQKTPDQVAAHFRARFSAVKPEGIDLPAAHKRAVAASGKVKVLRERLKLRAKIA